MKTRRRHGVPQALAVVLTALALLTLTAVTASGATPVATRVHHAPAPDACGKRIAKPGGGWWSCTFDDEFRGNKLNRSKWMPQIYFATGTPSAYTCYRDDPSNIRVGGGALHLTLLRVAQAMTCAGQLTPTHFVSGMVTTWHMFSQRYGRFQVRMRTTATRVRGLHEAFWLWPDNRYAAGQGTWPANGEIDVAETYSSNPNEVIPRLHYSTDAMQVGVNTAACRARRGVWNTYTMRWSAHRIAIRVNGKRCLVNISGDPAFRKRYIINLTQGLGPSNDSWVPGTRIPATTDVDYVRVWK